MREVLLRTDLWSDQVLVLRAVQTLTMLDVQHNCDLVWSLGGYTRTETEPGTELNQGAASDSRRSSTTTSVESSLPLAR
jgi:hypothetical protein